MRWLLPLLLLVISACERRSPISRAKNDEPSPLRTRDVVDIGTGPPLHHRCPLRGFWLDLTHRGVLVDACGDGWVTNDGGYSFAPIGPAPTPPIRALYERAMAKPDTDGIWGNVHYKVKADQFFAQWWGEPDTPRTLRTTGGGVYEAIREKRLIGDPHPCRPGEECDPGPWYVGRTEHALILSMDGARTWHARRRVRSRR